MTVKYIVIRNVYPFDINTQKVEELLNKLSAVHQHVTLELETFREFFGQTGNAA